MARNARESEMGGNGRQEDKVMNHVGTHRIWRLAWKRVSKSGRVRTEATYQIEGPGFREIERDADGYITGFGFSRKGDAITAVKGYLAKAQKAAEARDERTPADKGIEAARKERHEALAKRAERKREAAKPATLAEEIDGIRDRVARLNGDDLGDTLMQTEMAIEDGRGGWEAERALKAALRYLETAEQKMDEVRKNLRAAQKMADRAGV